MTAYIIVMLVSYLIGALPFAYIMVKISKGIDIRTVGSGNSGATNVSRVMGFRGFLYVFLFDFGKGVLPVIFLRTISDDGLLVMAGAIMLLVGHTYSIFLKFGGGKGVATGVGIAIALFPMAALIGFIVFIVALIVKKMVSLASIISAVSMVLFVIILGYHWTVILLVAMIALFIIYNHRTNIKRIKSGVEPEVKVISSIFKSR